MERIDDPASALARLALPPAAGDVASVSMAIWRGEMLGLIGAETAATQKAISAQFRRDGVRHARIAVDVPSPTATKAGPKSKRSIRFPP